MKITGFRSVLFSSLNVTAHTSADITGPSRQPVIQERLDNTPAYAGVSQGALTLSVTFIPVQNAQIEATFAALLAQLDPESDELGDLTGQLVDGTAITTEATLGSWRYLSVNQLEVDFIVPCGCWMYTSTTSSGTLAALTSTESTDIPVPVYNTGYKTVRPVIDIAWPGVTNRTSFAAAYGFRYRRQFTLTNNGTQTIDNVPVQIGPLDTQSLVTASKMNSDCSDLRIYRNGRQLRRYVIAPNWSSTYIWFVPDTLPVGATHTYDIVYGNSAANTTTYTSTGDNTDLTLVFSSQGSALNFTVEPFEPAVDIRGDFVPFTSSTSSSVTVTGASWETNQWKGGTIINSDGQMRRCASNTSATLVTTRNWSSNPSGTDKITVTKSGLKGDGGKSTGSSSGTTLTDSSQSWQANEWVGATFEVISGTGNGSTRTVSSNTATQLTLSSAITVDTTTSYRVYRNNGMWNYDMRNSTAALSQSDRNGTFRGLWKTNEWNNRPSQVRFDAPGSWTRGVYKRSTDAFSVPRAYKGGNDWYATPYFSRAREGRVGTQEEVGVADSVRLYTPFNILSFQGDIQFRSDPQNASLGGDPSLGMCKFVLGTQQSGGEDWQLVFQKTDDEATAVTVSLDTDFYTSDSNSVNRIMMALIPNAWDKVDDRIQDNENHTSVAYAYDDTWTVNLNGIGSQSSDLLQIGAIGSEAAIYDVNLDIQLDQATGWDPGRDWRKLDIGTTNKKIFLASTNKLHIDCDAQQAEIQDSSGNRLARVTHLILPYVYRQIAGSDVERISSDWLPIPANDNLIANPSFTTDLSGWEFVSNTNAGTVTVTRQTGTTFDGDGAIQFSFAATAANWTYLYRTSSAIPVTANATYLLAGWLRRSNSAITRYLYVNWYDSNQVFISSSSAVSSLASQNVFVPGFLSVTAPANAAYARVHIGATSATAVTAETVHHDLLYFGLGKSVLFFEDPATTPGALTITTTIQKGGFF